jgi:hypothetical protein
MGYFRVAVAVAFASVFAEPIANVWQHNVCACLYVTAI